MIRAAVRWALIPSTSIVAEGRGAKPTGGKPSLAEQIFPRPLSVEEDVCIGNGTRRRSRSLALVAVSAAYDESRSRHLGRALSESETTALWKTLATGPAATWTL